MTNPIARDVSQSNRSRSQSRRGNRRNEDAFPRFCAEDFLLVHGVNFHVKEGTRQFHSRNMSLGEAQPIGGASCKVRSDRGKRARLQLEPATSR